MRKLLNQVKRKYKHHLRTRKDHSGLCFAIYKLWTEGHITVEDYHFFNEFLGRNTPDVLYHYNGSILSEEEMEYEEGFWWPVGDTKSRLNWLDQQIKVKEV